MAIVAIHLGDRKWTIDALHLACAIARNQKTGVTLLRMMPVQHLSWLGTEVGNIPPTTQDYEDFKQYAALAEDYGVELTLSNMQYVTLADALVEAVAQIDAQALFAQLPKSRFTLWNKLQLAHLKSRLAMYHCALYTLETETDKETQSAPSVLVRATK